MRHCKIMQNVPVYMTDSNGQKTLMADVVTECVTDDFIFDYIENSIWGGLQVVFETESKDKLYTVWITGTPFVYGKGKGRGFKQALSRAFNHYITNKDKHEKQQDEMREKSGFCCLGSMFAVNQVDGKYLDEEGNTLKRCPYCLQLFKYGEDEG